MKSDQESVATRMMRFVFAPRFNRFDMLSILLVIWLLTQQQVLAAIVVAIAFVVISVFFERRLSAGSEHEAKTGESE
jgi:hypothetical protein